MNRITAAQECLARARGVREILTASYAAFDHLLLAIREHQERAGGLLAAFVLSAASAADGRDALTAAPSLPLPLPRADCATVAGAEVPDEPADIDDVADALAGLSVMLAVRLQRAADWAGNAGDRVACTDAARSAAAICSLLARPGP